MRAILVKMNALGAAEAATGSAEVENPLTPTARSTGLTFEQRKELLTLRIQLEKEKDIAVEKMRRGIEMEKTKDKTGFD